MITFVHNFKNRNMKTSVEMNVFEVAIAYPLIGAIIVGMTAGFFILFSKLKLNWKNLMWIMGISALGYILIEMSK